MRIIITGGTGLIGSALTLNLINDGHEVILLSRSLKRAKLLPVGTRIAKWDGKSAAGWGNLADGCDAIVNLAGESVAGKNLLSMRWTPERKKSILQSRLDAGKAVIDALENVAKKTRVLVQASAVGYYGTFPDNPEIDESSKPGDDFLASVCQQWEASTTTVEDMGVRRIIVRIGVVLSNQEGALPRQILPFKFFLGGPIGDGKQCYPWIHIADVVGAIRFLIGHEDAAGIFNLTSPHPINNAEFSQKLGQIMKRPSFLPTPAIVFKTVFGEAASILIGGQCAIPKHLLEIGYPYQYADLNGALGNLLT
jgi:uncharacterized protein (TIGR01777 family)